MTMYPFPHGETVTRLRGTPITDPYSGKRSGVSWDDPDELDFPDCAVWQASSVEPEDSLADRAEVATVTKAALPHNADITPADRFRARGEVYEVVGEVARYRHPFSGRTFPDTVTGRRVDG